MSYQGHDFSIRYPNGWIVSHLAESGGNLDTTFNPPGDTTLLMRVDENPNGGVASPDAAAAPVIADLRHDPTYIKLGISHDTFDGFPALGWEFENTVSGVRMHKIDEFFIDASGRSWGILIQAPQAAWAQDGPALDALRQTFQRSSGQQSAADAVYTYWSEIQLSNYAGAFGYLTSAEQQRLGGRTTFLNYFRNDPVTSVNVNIAVRSVSGNTAIVDVARLQTVGAATGCRNWAGSYRVVNEGSRWLIDSADLSYTAC